MKVLLINPSYKDSYGSAKAAIVDPIFPTIALLSLAAVAERDGHVVNILDMSYQQYDYKIIENKIRTFQPDIVGLTGTTPLMNQMRDISVLVKSISSKILVVAGGAHVSALPKESLLESMIDIVVVGEGEITFAEILSGKSLKEIQGICYKDSLGNTYLTAPRSFIANLDELPMPAWHHYDSAEYKYKISKLLARRRPLAMIEFSRGCIYKCDFCASKMTMAFGYRKKSPQRCAEEVKLLYKYGWREFALADDIFTSDNKWAKEVAQAIIDTKLDVLWTCTNGIRVESADDELFRVMRKAGCYRVSFGFETGNTDVLKAFGKGGKATLSQGVHAVRSARKAGIDTNGFFMLGLSPDTEESMKDTINYSITLPLDMMKFGIAIGFPGTKMFKEARENNLVQSYNWDDYFIYTTKPLFAHKNLTFDKVKEHMDLAYKTAILYNYKFIVRRIWRGIKTLEFFWDVYYFFKFFSAPTINKQTSAARYFAKESWPKYDFKNAKIDFTTYRSAGGKTFEL